MNLENKKKVLYAKHKLDVKDFYVLENKIIVRRTGLDKLEKDNPGFNLTVESIQTVPFGDGVCTTIYGSARLNPAMNSAKAVASANPKNCNWPYYGEVAFKRLRHKLLLTLLDLYEHDIYSEEESEDFKEPRPKTAERVAAEIDGINKKRSIVETLKKS